MGLSVGIGTMMARWDEMKREGGRLKEERFSVGSGSPYACGVLGNGYWYDLSVEEVAELARRAIYRATFRDGASGGVVNVYYVGPNGWKKLSDDDVGEFHYNIIRSCQARWNRKWLKFLALDSFLSCMSSFRTTVLMAFLKSYTA